MNRLLLAFFLLLPTLAQAQETASLPPDAAGVFAPGIEITASEIVPDRTPMMTAPRFDDESRVVSVFDHDARAYITFAYPDDIDTLRLIAIRSDNSLTLSPTPEDNDPFTPEQYLQLDPQTGVFTTPDLQCGVVPPLAGDETTWVFYADPQVRRISVCDSATGEPVALVPRDRAGLWIEASPTGSWIIWAVGNRETRVVEVYATERATGTQNYLGSYGKPDWDWIDRWVNEHTGIIYTSYGGESFPKDLLRFDVTQPDSLHRAFTGRYDTYYPDPPQYHYLQTHSKISRYADPMSTVPCNLSIYYPVEDRVAEYGMADDCGGIFTVDPDKYIYLGFNDDGSSSVYGLDVPTREITEYLRGEIEILTDVSPDGRYLTVITDSDGVLRTAGIDIQFVGLHMFRESATAKLAVFDSENRQFVYEQAIFPYRPMDWVDADTLVIAETEDAPWAAPIRFEVLEFSDDGMESREIANAARIWAEGSLVPNGRHLLVWTEAEDGIRGISLLDLETDALTPFILNMHPLNNEVRLTDISSSGVTAEFNGFRYTLSFP